MGHADEQQARTPGGRDRAGRGAFVCGTPASDVAAAERGAPAVEPPSCPACGAQARRAAARHCATCGGGLRGRDYTPTDGLRASYRWPAITPPRTRPTHAPGIATWRHRSEETARGYVFLAYSLVPFVGLAFCACALVCCAAGLRDARLEGHRHAAASARRGLAYAVLLAGAQTFIWLFVLTIPLWL